MIKKALMVFGVLGVFCSPIEHGRDDMPKVPATIRYEECNDAPKSRYRELLENGYRDSFVAELTAYALNGKTSTGEIVRPGIVAVDPRIIPYYSKLYIPVLDPTNPLFETLPEDVQKYGRTRWDGYFYAEDCGGKVKGFQIDVSIPNERNIALAFGRRRSHAFVKPFK
jgi:3D (Asp-Asp-Asp) domain-containing protein